MTYPLLARHPVPISRHDEDGPAQFIDLGVALPRASGRDEQQEICQPLVAVAVQQAGLAESLAPWQRRQR